MNLRAFEQFGDGKSSESLMQSNMICFMSEQDHHGCWVGRQEILGHRGSLQRSRDSRGDWTTVGAGRR